LPVRAETKGRVAGAAVHLLVFDRGRLVVRTNGPTPRPEAQFPTTPADSASASEKGRLIGADDCSERSVSDPVSVAAALLQKPSRPAAKMQFLGDGPRRKEVVLLDPALFHHMGSKVSLLQPVVRDPIGHFEAF
jgi:hypothetical protein